MIAPKDRESYENGDLFPALSIEFISHEGELIPRMQGPVVESANSGRYSDIVLGTGAVRREDGDNGWSRASFPLHLLGRYVGEVRNCVATFVYSDDTTSSLCLQCSQEIDTGGRIANHFDRSIHTNASTSLGAVYTDGTFYA